MSTEDSCITLESEGPDPPRSKRTFDAGAAHIATQTSASLEGTGTKIKIPFDLSVVNNSLCIRLEDNGTNTNCRVQRHSRRGSWGGGEGVVEKPFGFRAPGAGETERQPRQRKRFPQGGTARSAMMLTRPAGGHVRRTRGRTQTSLLGARVFAFSFNVFSNPQVSSFSKARILNQIQSSCLLRDGPILAGSFARWR